MGKEKKIGLAVLGTLMLTLVSAFAVKMSMARDDGLSSLRDADPSAAEKPRSRISSKLMDRLSRESNAERAAGDDKREPLKLATFEEERPKLTSQESDVGDRYATPVSTEAAPVVTLASNIEERRPEAATIVSPMSNENPAAAADPFRAPAASDPFPKAEPMPNHEPMTHHHGLSQDPGLVALEGAPALQTAHDESKPGFVHHASPPGSNYVDATQGRYTQPTNPSAHPTHPNTQERYPETSPTHPNHPSLAERYLSNPSPQPEAPRYDIYGHEHPAEPSPLQSHHQPMPSTQVLPHEHTPATTRFAPDEYRAAMVAARQHDGSEKYTIRPNDSFYSISETVYGTGSYFKALEEHNREQVPYSDRMRVGDVISTPRVETLHEKYPDLCPRRRAQPNPQAQSHLMSASLHGLPQGKVYVVQQGDSLFDIARSELGKASRWGEIYELNRHRLGDDIDYLAPGTELVLPETGVPSQSPLTTERRPASTTR